MALEPWEIIISDLALGSLISGFLLFFFSVFTAGFHFGGHGGHSGHGGHGHFGHIGQHFHVNTHLHLSQHFHFGHAGHGGHAHGHAQHGAKLEQNPSTPILLIVSAFLLMFGAIGTVVYQLALFDSLIRILLVFVFPIVFVKLVSKGWDKLVGNEFGYDIPTVSIDNQVKTLTNVDEKGGLVLADTGDWERPETLKADEKMKMYAKTLPGVSIERETIAYVIDIKDNALIIDLWPRQAKKTTDNI